MNRSTGENSAAHGLEGAAGLQGASILKPEMTIIGFGKIGKRFTEVFSAGFDVGVISGRDIAAEAGELGARRIDNWEEAVASSNYILLAVPLHALAPVIRRINPHVGPKAWAFDMCSARVSAGKEMASLKCRWFGIHAGYVIGEAPDEILRYLSGKGYDLLPVTAEDHDARNSIVAMVQFIGMTVDALLTESERRYLEEKSPASVNLLKLIDHLKGNAPATYWESQLRNGYSKSQRHRLIQALEAYSDKLDRGFFPFSEKLYDVKMD